MTVRLGGDVFVTDLLSKPLRKAGVPVTHDVISKGDGSVAISLRAVRIPAGRSSRLGNSVAEELLYVVEGTGSIGGLKLEPDMGFYLEPGRAVDIQAKADLVLASARCPDPGRDWAMPEGSHEPPANRLDDRPKEEMDERWFCTMFDEDAAGTRMTQFVGSIPPGKSPPHFHPYEEAIVILAGEGTLWAGGGSADVEAGSCIFLPKGAHHSLENTGEDDLRLVGIFHPVGSPADSTEVG